MRTLTGIAVSPGITIGKVFCYQDDSIRVPKYDVSADEVPNEKRRLTRAVERAKSELQALRDQSSVDVKRDGSGFLDSHLLMLEDPEFLCQIETGLGSELKNIEWIVYRVIEENVGKLKSAADAYLRERALDMNDVAKRVLNHLLFRERISLGDLAQEVVIVTHNLLPSDALAMNKTMVRGIAMDEGGKTSHTAILARAFEIPAVVGLSNITESVRTGDDIIVDGNKGLVIVKPDETTLAKYRRSYRAWHKRERELQTLNELPAETRDGKMISLMANIEVPEETGAVLSHGADGIGLYRSEFLYLGPGGVSSEDEQYDAYRRVLQDMGERTVTIRTLDLGGDKVSDGLREVNEPNPILGWRAIRYCLSNPEVFQQQLRALLRAAVHGNLQIMFPMISGIEELDAAMDMFDQAKESLRRDGIEFREGIPIGIMIETPSAALTSDILARHVSFFSIGTNDLIQYTIAVDRGNERIAYLYEPFHPGVLRLLKTVIDHAHEAGIPVSMCGEMAGDPGAAAVLLGLGLDAYSMTAFTIPEVKRIIRAVTMEDAEELVGTILLMESFVEIDRYVGEWMNERFDFLNKQ